MKHERNALQEHVFPKLEELCGQNGFQFQAIDLRWGVSSEAGLDHRTMRICFDELRLAQEISPKPNFLILLGNRYGWRPLPEEISVEEFKELEVASEQIATTGDKPPTAIVLREWYRKDENAIPSVYVLQSRRQGLPDYKDYTQDAAWNGVQSVLWEIINHAYQPVQLKVRFDREMQVNSSPSAIVRFQGSATEQEIWHGALRISDAQDHVLAFFRQIENISDFPDPEQIKDFIDVALSGSTDPSLPEELTRLKETLALRLGKSNVFTHPARLVPARDTQDQPTIDVTTNHIEQLCTGAESRLIQIIQEQIEEYWNKTAQASMERTARELQIEQDEHKRFGSERGGAHLFVGRITELSAIRDYLQNDSPWPLVIHGASGCGKTALMWRAFEEIPETKEPIIRLIGTTPHSSDVRSLLRNLCQKLRERNQRGEELPSDIKALERELQEHFRSADPEQPLILFLDALDQLSDADHGRLLSWIPTDQLQPHVKLVVSCLSDGAKDDPAGQPFAELTRRQFPAKNIINLDELSEEDASTLLFNNWLHQVGRKVSNQQRERIEQVLKSKECRQPIYLKLLFEEARLWHSYDAAPGLGESVPAILGQFFDRLSQPVNHNPLLVKRVLGYLVTSRHGLAENEILEVLFADPDYKAELDQATEQTRHELPASATRIPIAIWSRFRFDLAPYLTERAAVGANVLTFYHRQVAEWVREHFAKSSNQSWHPHRRLADYFEPKPTSPRRDDELPWQLCEAESWTRLNGVLSDPEYLRRSFHTKETDVKRFWSQLETHSDYTMVGAYEPIFWTGDRHADLAATVAVLLDNAGHLGESVSLWKLLWSSVRETSNLKSVQSVVGIVGLALFECGDIDGAMQAFEEQERICLMMRNVSGLFGLQASLGNQGEVCFHSGELDRALELFHKQEAICREIDNDDGLQHSLGNQGSVLCTMGKFAEARELLKLQEKICQERGDTLHLHVARSSLAGMDYACGYLDRALTQLKESEVAFRKLGNKTHLVNNLTIQGHILAKNGDSNGCLPIYEEADAICALIGDRNRRIHLLELKGSLLQTSRRWAEALKAYEEEERLCRKFGEKADLQEALRNQAAVHMNLGELEQALKLCAKTEEVCTEIGNPQGLADALFCRGQIFQVKGDVPRALDCLKGAEKNFASIGHQYGVATVRVSLALVAQSQGHFSEALSLLREAESAFEELGNRAGIALALGHQGLILRTQGRLREAMSMHQEEIQIVRKLNDEDGIARSLGNQAVLLKDFGELDEALKFHAEEERISRKLESKDRIQVSLGNQAVIHTLRRNFEQALVLQSEKEKICRELGNKHSLATSLGGQANIRYEQGHLAEAVRLYLEEERLCRELENPVKLATSLYNQAVARYSNGQIPEALSLAEEAYLLSTLNELPLSATIIQFLDYLRYME